MLPAFISLDFDFLFVYSCICGLVIDLLKKTLVSY